MVNCCNKNKDEISLQNEKDPEEDYDSDEDKVEEDGRGGACGYKTGIHEAEQTSHNQQLTRVKKKRWPTDVPCLVLFVAFCIGMVALGIASFVIGSPSRLYQPTDYLGRLCGSDNSNITSGTLKIPRDADCIAAEANSKNTTAAAACEAKVKAYKTDLTNQKYLWFMDISQPMTYGGVCVQYCPNSVSNLPKCPPELNSTTLYDPLTGSREIGQYCSYIRADNPYSFPPGYNVQAVSSVMKFDPTVLRCMPLLTGVNSTGLNTSTILDSLLTDATLATAQVWTDVSRSWKILVFSVIIAIFVSFVLLFLLRMFADIMVWGSLLFCGACISGLAALLIWQGYTSKVNLTAKGLSTKFAEAVLYTGFGVAGITAIYFFLLIFLFLRIRNAVGIIKEASKSIAYLPQLVILPLGLSVLLTGLAAWWITVAVFLFSYGTPMIDGYAVRYKLSTATQGVFAYHVFGGLWIANFLIAFEYMVVASCIASWYWSRKKRFNIFGFPIWKAIIRVLLYHTGTIAFGSLIVAIIQFIRLLFEKLVREMEQAHKQGKIVRGLIWYVRTVLWIFEKIVKFINKQAYIQTAMYGTSFICAARDGMALVMRNPIQIGVITTMANIVLFVTRLAIAFLTAIFAYALSSQTSFLIDDSASNPINSPILVGFIAFFIGFLVGSLFMVILETAIDTITQCYLIDMEMTVDANYEPYGTGSLRRYLNEQKKFNSARNFFCRVCICCDSGNTSHEVVTKTPVIAVEEN